MARTPRAGVPKTTGQGVSRLAYQKGYSLGNRGGFGNTEVAAGSTSKPKKLKAPESIRAAANDTLRKMTGDEQRKGRKPK